MEKPIGALEALLFVAGDEGLSLKQISSFLSLTEVEALNLVEALQEKLDQRESALLIIYSSQTYKLATHPTYADLIESYAQSSHSKKLSQAALEILAIIAYRQPITRLDIEDIRGLSSSGPLQKLLLHGLIKEDGRLDLPGRPILYRTTDEFLDVFGLATLEDLPEMKVEKEVKHILYDSYDLLSDTEKDEE